MKLTRQTLLITSIIIILACVAGILFLLAYPKNTYGISGSNTQTVRAISFAIPERGSQIPDGQVESPSEKECPSREGLPGEYSIP